MTIWQFLEAVGWYAEGRRGVIENYLSHEYDTDYREFLASAWCAGERAFRIRLKWPAVWQSFCATLAVAGKGYQRCIEDIRDEIDKPGVMMNRLQMSVSGPADEPLTSRNVVVEGCHFDARGHIVADD